jgi:DNA-binding MarR family transcriptional regulator
MLRMRKQASEQMYALMAEVAALHRSLHDVGEAVAAVAGLTHTRLGCLREVADEPRPVATVAARQGVTRQGVQRTADGLVADGLARWIDNPRHRRAKLLTPSRAGRRALAAAADAHAAWVAQAAARLPKDLVDLTGRLRAVREIVAEPAAR